MSNRRDGDPAFESVLVAMALTAGRKESAEWQRRVWLSAPESPSMGGYAMRGKYIKSPSGYVHIREDGSGRFLHNLPEGIGAADVVDRDLDIERTPLQNRLRALSGILRNSGAEGDAALATRVEGILDACDPRYDVHLAAEIRARASEGTQLLLSGHGDEAIESAPRFLSWLAHRLSSTREAMTGDGALAASLAILGLLPFAIAEAAGSGVISLATSVGFVGLLLVWG